MDSTVSAWPRATRQNSDDRGIVSPGDNQAVAANADTAGAMRVTVAVATYRRSEYLAELLTGLLAQTRQCRAKADILVVDNNPLPDAAGVAATFPASHVRYVHEPKPGISAARNRALDECRERDAIVFIDDDEQPQQAWLNELVACWRAFRCAAVSGPVVSRFEVAPSRWAVHSGMFDRLRAPTGAVRRGAASNNLLLDMRWMVASGLRFDERFGLTGGSDTMLTHALVAQGGQIRWSDRAEVSEVVPTQRTTRAWILRRTIRTSNDWSRMSLVLAGPPPAREVERLNLMARGGVRMLRGVVGAAGGLLAASDRSRIRGMCVLASGYGMIIGALGRIRSEYGRG